MDIWGQLLGVLGGFLLGIFASIFIVPPILKKQQQVRENRLAKTLLREWCSDCIAAMMRLKPITPEQMQIEDYGKTLGSGGYVSELEVTTQFLKDIREGKRKPDGSAMVINSALEKALFSDEELTSKGPLPDVRYSFCSGDPAVPRAMIQRVLNPMYAKLDIFELEHLPIHELEMAMSDLVTMSQQGCITRNAFLPYALHLAQSMERFAAYLWKLKGWS